MEKVRIAVVDDHQLFRSGLINVLKQIDESFDVVADFSNGKEYLEYLKGKPHLDVTIMDVNMPVMDGFETLEKLKAEGVKAKVLNLTMLDDEMTLLRLLRSGSAGFLNKDIDPNKLRTAIHSVMEQGNFFDSELAGKLVNMIQHSQGDKMAWEPSEREFEFIKHAATDKSYAQIADAMNVSTKTVDNYRASCFEKLQVKSRIGLVISALKLGLLHLEDL